MFIKQARDTGKITITSKEMTRFFLTLQEAIDLLVHAATVSHGGEVFVMKMRSCRIMDVAQVLANHYAKGPAEFLETGIRPGEKLHEVLVSRYEADHAYKFDRRYYVILPFDVDKGLMSRYAQYPRFEHRSYESNMDLISLDSVHRLLQRGGFLT